MSKERIARLATLAALLGMMAVLVWPPVTVLAGAAALPLALLAALGLRPGRRWGGWVAVLMVPYVAVAAMNILAGPMPAAAAIGLGAGTVAAFLGGLGWMRSIGATLKG
ncbi:MAG: hypothetical protein ACR2QB_06055 [Gammaproteobacteria bacterium]